MPARIIEANSISQTKRSDRCPVLKCCHIRTCAYVIGIIELLTLGAAVVTLFVLYELSADSYIAIKVPVPVQKNRDETVNERLSLPVHENNITNLESNERDKLLRSSESSEETDGQSSESEESEEDEEEKSKRVVYLIAKHRYYVKSMAGTAAAFVIGVFVVILMFVGVARKRSKLFIPHLCVQVIAAIGLLILVTLYSIACLSNKTDANQNHPHDYPANQLFSCWFAIVSCCSAFSFDLISLWYILSIYKYLKHLHQYPNIVAV